MKNKLYALASLLILLMMSCKNEIKNKAQVGKKDLVQVNHELGNSNVPKEPQKVYVFDMGSLETLADLGISVAGIPKDFVPTHLKSYLENTHVVDVGSILQPNLEKLSTENADLIIISSLHASDYKALTSIAPTVSLGVDSRNYTASVLKNLATIGNIFGVSEITDQKIALLKADLEAAKKIIAPSQKKIMLLMYNSGAFSTFGPQARYSFVFNDLQAKSAANTEDTSTHGTVISSEYISKANPDILFIIDRNEIMDGVKTNPKDVENALIQKTKAYKNKQIYYLDPNIWYISGGGTYSMKHMITDIKQAYY